MDGGVFKLAFLAFHFDQCECGNENGVVHRGECPGFEARLEDFGRLAFVVGEHALVEGGVERDDGLIAKQNGKESERGDVTAHHHKADGEGHGEDKADRPPD